LRGRRRDVSVDLMEPGDYGRARPDSKSSLWFCCTPSGDHGNLALHKVVEHEDGTITVTPSIRVAAGDVERWRGYLERGVWRQV
jgi:hypothetical protein